MVAALIFIYVLGPIGLGLILIGLLMIVAFKRSNTGINLIILGAILAGLAGIMMYEFSKVNFSL